MYLQLGWRNLWRNPRRTLIILTAIIIGISSMVVLAALSRGTMENMIDNAINNLIGHIRIQNPGYRVDPAIEHSIVDTDTIIAEIIPLLPPGTRVAKRIVVDGMLSTSREHVGIILVGIEPERESGLSFIGNGVTEGRMFTAEETNSLVIGKALLDKLAAKTGRKVVVMSQNGEGDNISKAFRIAGIYRTELAATEKTYVFAPLAAVEKMLSARGNATEISLVLDQQQGGRTRQDPLAQTLRDRLQGKNLEILQWQEILPAMDAYLEMFDGFMLIWYMVVFIAMGFGLVNTMLMAVYERMREFGLLRAIGMRSSRIITMVLGETLLLLATGILVANGLAVFTILVVLKSGIDISVFSQSAEMWGMGRVIIPVLTTWDLAMANAVVIGLGLLVGLYPAARASRFTPMETMRHI